MSLCKTSNLPDCPPPRKPCTAQIVPVKSSGQIKVPILKDDQCHKSRLEFFNKATNPLSGYEWNRVFVNHVDSYVGRHLVDYFGMIELKFPDVESVEVVQQEEQGEGRSEKFLQEFPISESNEVVSPSIIAEPSIAPEVSEVQMHTDNFDAISFLNDSGHRGECLSIESISFGEECKLICEEECICEEDLSREEEGIEDMEESTKKGEDSSLDGECVEEEEKVNYLPSFLKCLLNDEELCHLNSMEDKVCKANYLRRIIIEKEDSKRHEKARRFYVCGTMKNPNSKAKSHFLSEIVCSLNDYLPTLLKSSLIIFDITRDPGQIKEARWALNGIIKELEALESKSVLEFQKIRDVRKFVLISSVMTWANSNKVKKLKEMKELDSDQRKPHRLWREHKYLEQDVIRAGQRYSNIFKTCVIWSGLAYGHEEERLNFLFELGWNNKDTLPVLGIGTNIIPLIHVSDLAMIVYYAATIIQDSPSHLFAVEKNSPSLKSITERISRGLTTGNIYCWMESTRLPPHVKIHEDTLAMLTTDMRINSSVIYQHLALPWRFKGNFITEMPKVIDEYIQARHLQPFRIIVLGPPGSGKTMISKKLANLYNVTYLNIEEELINYITELETEKKIEDEQNQKYKIKIRGGLVPEEENSDLESENHPDEEESGETSGSMKAELEEILRSMKIYQGMPSDAILVRIMSKRLLDMNTLNHGYVLDGWPLTFTQCEELFKEVMPDDNDFNMDSGEEEIRDMAYGKNYNAEGSDMGLTSIPRRQFVRPTHAILLEAECDELLFKILTKKRDLGAMRPSSISLAERMRSYLSLMYSGNNAFEYLDNIISCSLLRLNIDKDMCPMLGSTLRVILAHLGPPTNKGAVAAYLEEYEMMKTIFFKKIKDDELKFQEESDRIDYEYFKAARNFMDKWMEVKEGLIHEVQQCPFPSKVTSDEFIGVYVMPALVNALIAYQNSQEDSYLEFFAEYFLSEYERSLNRSSNELMQSAADIARDNKIFTKCVEALLEHCDLSHISILPGALTAIKKYKRLNVAKEMDSRVNLKKSGSTVADFRFTCFKHGMDVTRLRRKLLEGYRPSKIERGIVLKDQMRKLPDERDQESHMEIKDLLEAFIITNPLWKDKLRATSEDQTEVVSVGDACDNLPTDSLAKLLQQLKAMSEEIKCRMELRRISAVLNSKNENHSDSRNVWSQQHSSGGQTRQMDSLSKDDEIMSQRGKTMSSGSSASSAVSRVSKHISKYLNENDDSFRLRWPSDTTVAPYRLIKICADKRKIKKYS